MSLFGGASILSSRAAVKSIRHEKRQRLISAPWPICTPRHDDDEVIVADVVCKTNKIEKKKMNNMNGKILRSEQKCQRGRVRKGGEALLGVMAKIMVKRRKLASLW